MKKDDIKKIVREGYSKIARRESSSGCGPESCCGGGTRAEAIGKQIGYGEEELASAPEGANLGLGCGNPVALASLAPGETVVDLGSGAGFDCFLAAGKVGDAGCVIGIDMTPDMIECARANAKKAEYQNVEFRLGDIENIPLPDDSADVLISNCVINLSPDKARVFKEAYRILRPGGRMYVSDIVLLEPLPAVIKENVEAYIGCIAGAEMKEAYLQCIEDAGFVDIQIEGESTYGVDWVEMVTDLKKSVEIDRKTIESFKPVKDAIVSIKVSGKKAS